ncbi:MAG: glycoside hydrolase family 3 C-terminal domain-containing protein [Bacilli bacterium]
MKKTTKIWSVAALAMIMLTGCNGNPSATGSTSTSASVAPSVQPSTEPSTNPSTEPSASAEEEDDEFEEIVETEKEATGYTTGNLSAKGKFYTDYATFADEQVAAKETAIQIAAEGDTLLKNADKALPLSSGEKHVTLFGMHSVNLITAGGGSGAGTTGNNGMTPSTLESSLTDAGFSVNPVTLNLYNAYTAMGTVNNELPIANYTPSTIASYYGYGEAAIITISRQGTENKDLETNNVADHANEDDHTLQLDDNEVALIKHVKQNFGKVIVLINSSNIMQIPELAEEKTETNMGVDAILWIGGVGNNGVDAVGQILNGSVCPSGHTSDLWTRDFTKDPSFTNFGFDSQNKDSDGTRLDAAYYNSKGEMTNYTQVEYREGIYNGYRYYETVADDKGSATGESWYNENVLYPFGYGLSYTSFEWKWANVKDGLTISKANQTVTARIKVTNTGSVAGKDVVQLYYSAPYTKNGIEKSSTNLAGFAKTKMLEPGESDVVTVQFLAQDMASYDYNDKNKNDFKGYELEAGTYTITANRNSHEKVLSTTRKVATTIQCKTDTTTGKEIKPIFSQDDQYISTNSTLLANQISRAAGLTQPVASTKADRTVSDEKLAKWDDQDIYEHYENNSTDPWYVNASGKPSTWTQEATTTTYKLADMAGVDYQDVKIDSGAVVIGTDEGSKKWEDFMNQLTWADLCNIVSGDAHSGPGMAAMENIGKDKDNYADGPVQIRGGTLFPSAPILAASYNVDLGERMGRFVGNEGIFLGLSQWAGSAMDTHRSPFSGRNFEYYSQDGVHAAKFAAAVVKGAVSKGLISYCKHFFLNDQESYRADFGGVFTFADEQTIREIYLKPFEAAVKAGSMGLMSSFNRIGEAITAESYAVHQYLLRDEWDSKADVCTDAWAKAYVPVNLMAVAGSDQLLGSSKSYSDNALDWGTWDAESNVVKVKANADATENTLNSETLYAGLRIRAQRALYTRANSTTNKNGAVAGETLSVTLEKDVSNNVKISDEDIQVTLAEGATMPAGLSITNGMVVSGKPAVEGDYQVNVNVTKDGWISSTAVLDITVKSALHVDGKAITTGETNATYKAGTATTSKIDVPSLAYGTLVDSRYLIVNYYTKDFTNYNRNEDKTASDIITIDAATADESHEYAYSYTGNIPAGMTLTTVEKDWIGKANKGSYKVADYYELAGTPTTKGTYTFTVTLTVPKTMYMMSWLFASFGCTTTTFTQEVTVVVE